MKQNKRLVFKLLMENIIAKFITARTSFSSCTRGKNESNDCSDRRGKDEKRACSKIKRARVIIFPSYKSKKGNYAIVILNAVM